MRALRARFPNPQKAAENFPQLQRQLNIVAQTREANTIKIRQEDAEESRNRRKRSSDLVLGGADGDDPNAETPTVPTPRLAGDLVVGLARRAHGSFTMKGASLSHILHGSQASPASGPRGSTDSAHGAADEVKQEQDEAEAQASASDVPRDPTDQEGRLLPAQLPATAKRRNTPILAPLGSAQSVPSDESSARRGALPGINGDAANPSNGLSSTRNDASTPPVTPPRTANKPPSATDGAPSLDDSPRAGSLEATVMTRLDALDTAQRENASMLLRIMARLDQLAPPAEPATRGGREAR